MPCLPAAAATPRRIRGLPLAMEAEIPTAVAAAKSVSSVTCLQCSWHGTVSRHLPCSAARVRVVSRDATISL